MGAAFSICVGSVVIPLTARSEAPFTNAGPIDFLITIDNFAGIKGADQVTPREAAKPLIALAEDQDQFALYRFGRERKRIGAGVVRNASGRAVATAAELSDGVAASRRQLANTPLDARGLETGSEVYQAQYVASRRGQVYYWVGCSAWRSLTRANLIYFETAEAAQAAGYRASASRGCAGPGNESAVHSAAPQDEVERKDTLPRPADSGCTVARVIDGDTIECQGGTRVRLLLIDAPEMSQGPFGEAAKKKLEELLPRGEPVTLEMDVQGQDRYGRTLAYLHRGPVFVNRELVRSGVAVVSVYPPNVRHVELFRAAADSARAEKAGLWSGSAFECLPADYRRQRCK